MKTLHLRKGYRAMPVTHQKNRKGVIVIDTVSP